MRRMHKPKGSEIPTWGGGGAFAQTILLIPTIETILSTIKGTWDPLGNTERKSKPWTVRSAGGLWKYGGVYQT